MVRFTCGKGGETKWGRHGEWAYRTCLIASRDMMAVFGEIKRRWQWSMLKNDAEKVKKCSNRRKAL